MSTIAAGTVLPPMHAKRSAITANCPTWCRGVTGVQGVSGFGFRVSGRGSTEPPGVRLWWDWITPKGPKGHKRITTRVASPGGSAAHASSSGISSVGT